MSTSRHSLPHPASAWLAALLLSVLLTACAGGEAVGTGPTSEVPDPSSPAALPAEPIDAEPTSTDPAATEPSTPPVPEGAFVGELGGSNIEGGCVWLDAEDGTRYELIAGPNSSVAIDPANMVVADAETGEVVARPGDAVVVEGEVDEGLMTFCQVGVNLVVEDVSAR